MISVGTATETVLVTKKGNSPLSLSHWVGLISHECAKKAA